MLDYVGPQMFASKAAALAKRYEAPAGPAFFSRASGSSTTLRAHAQRNPCLSELLMVSCDWLSDCVVG